MVFIWHQHATGVKAILYGARLSVCVYVVMSRKMSSVVCLYCVTHVVAIPEKAGDNELFIKGNSKKEKWDTRD